MCQNQKFKPPHRPGATISPLLVQRDRPFRSQKRSSTEFRPFCFAAAAIVLLNVTVSIYTTFLLGPDPCPCPPIPLAGLEYFSPADFTPWQQLKKNFVPPLAFEGEREFFIRWPVLTVTEVPSNVPGLAADFVTVGQTLDSLP